MAIHDYRFNPFENTFDIKKIFDERHVIPSNSPYTLRLAEVPQKTSPTTLQVKFQNGNLLTEVSEEPAQGQYCRIILLRSMVLRAGTREP